MLRNLYTPYFVFALHVLVLLCFHAFGFTGHYGYDDMQYAQLANDLTLGQMDFGDHFSYRWPIVGLTALAYSIFGVSDFASAVPPMLATIGILWVVLVKLRSKGTTTVSIGLSLTLFAHWFLFYSDKLMPDIYVALAVVLLLAIVHSQRYGSGKKRPLWMALGFAAALLFGFMAKGSVVLILPLLVFWAIPDLWKKRNVRFWIAAIAASILFFVGYFGLVYGITGDAMQRFKAIGSNSYLNKCSYDAQPLHYVLERIGYKFYNLFIERGLFVGFAVIGAYFLQGRKQLKGNTQLLFFAGSAVVLFFSCNFMTISPTSYNPMCLDVRHYFFLVPLAAIPAAMILGEFLKSGKNGTLLFVFMLLAAMWCTLLDVSFALKLYLPIAVILGIFAFWEKSRQFGWVFALLLAIASLVKPMENINYANAVGYQEQKHFVEKHLLSNQDPLLVVTDHVQARLGNYYNGFDTTSPIQFVAFRDFKNDSSDQRKKVLLLNSHTQYLAKLAPNDLPYYARNIHPENELLQSDPVYHMELYALTTVQEPKRAEEPFFSSQLTFDSDKPSTGWKYTSTELVERFETEDQKMNMVQKVTTYSATFNAQLGMLAPANTKQVYVNASLKCLVLKESTAKLVVSVENEDGTVYWDAVDVNKYVPAYDNWFTVGIDATLNYNPFENQEIKVYLLNENNEIIYIDNPTISFYTMEL